MFRTLFQRILGWVWRYSGPRYSAVFVTEHPKPEFLMPRMLIVIGGPGFQKWCYLQCPCGCGETIMLPLMPNQKPRWHVEIDRWTLPTVYPSVRRLDGCYSHFWIRRGTIEWCLDTGKVPSWRIAEKQDLHLWRDGAGDS